MQALSVMLAPEKWTAKVKSLMSPTRRKQPLRAELEALAAEGGQQGKLLANSIGRLAEHQLHSRMRDFDPTKLANDAMAVLAAYTHHPMLQDQQVRHHSVGGLRRHG